MELKIAPFHSQLDQSVTTPSSFCIFQNSHRFRKIDTIGEKKREEKKKERKTLVA